MRRTTFANGGVDFTDADDALVHRLCQHSAVAAKEDYCSSGAEMELPPSACIAENSIDDPGGAMHHRYHSFVHFSESMLMDCSLRLVQMTLRQR